MEKILSELKEQFNQEEVTTHLCQNEVSSFCEEVTFLLMLDYYNPEYKEEDLIEHYKKAKELLNQLLSGLVSVSKNEIIDAFFQGLPSIRKTLNTSIDAIFVGDPASVSKQQIVLEYPGFEAILFYRIAHEFYLLHLPLLSRSISEIAHHHTGIDINPGATIGDYFFIDHGTGIVIGETAIIGNHVKLYQGVTLGALSLSKGRDLKGTKRHPTVEDYVTIYSNAAIFGGNTVIGTHSTIGGDVYLTHSVKPYSIVLQTDKNLTILTNDQHKSNERH